MAKAGLLFVGTNDGIALYSEPGALGRGIRVGQELRGIAITSVWVWADNPLHVIATSGAQLYRSEDGGGTWHTVSGAPSGIVVGSRAAQANVLCIDANGMVWKSSDAGVQWEVSADTQIRTGPSLAASDGASGTVAVASGREVAISSDHGATWRMVETLPADAQQLTVHPGEHTPYVIIQQQILSYHDGQWRPIATPIAAAGGLAILAGNRPTLLAATPHGEISYSSDNGETWAQATHDAGWQTAPRVISVAPYHMDTAFAGGETSVAITTDRGNTWRRLKGDLAGVTAIASARLI